MHGFDSRWKDFPDYIIGITKEIWEGRGIGTLNHYYTDDIPVRSPMGISIGNAPVMAATMATLREFPDRTLYGEDVIWSGTPETALLSSHRIVSTATHSHDGLFGKATGKKLTYRIIADCAAKDNAIFDEWLIRDYGGIVRQLGHEPRKFAKKLIKAEGGVDKCAKPFTPEIDVDGGYHSRGNDNEWGKKYASTLSRMMANEFDIIPDQYDRAVLTEYAGSQTGISHGSVNDFWMGLRSSFPNADFKIHHQIGLDGDMLSPRAAIRWSLDGKHDGWGSFGKPTGADIHVMGMCHAEYGPFGNDGSSIRREYALYDEIAVWKQILMQNN
ncbi:ester cyclase [Lentilitoribacter sp. Alg239-R112]|uniref:nuclear transport factor 2 family protein n=1 Tax=Lentilitoribacter sp. Alg239-R112 TaxID=2305987 RepID=UPI0013A6D957|nr:ester cyclase [Lentilitoribacter sp. Alg239-R112]